LRFGDFHVFRFVSVFAVLLDWWNLKDDREERRRPKRGMLPPTKHSSTSPAIKTYSRHPTTERRWHAIERKGAADVLPKTNLKRGLILMRRRWG